MNKKRWQKSSLSLLVIIFAILMINVNVVMAAGSANFALGASSGTVRVGDTITVTGSVSASGAIATFDLDVVYDAGKLQYTGASAAGSVGAGELDISAGSGRVQFLYLDDGGGTSGVTGGAVFQLSFKVIGGQPGDTIGLSYSIRTVGDASAQPMSAAGSGAGLTVAAPLSTNNNLSSLTVSTGSLSPAFSAGVVNYRMNVPYSVEHIDLRAAAQDAKASVSINSPALAAGTTTNLSVIVRAESGAQKTYTIAVSREQDPNYVPDDNTDLASLAVEGFLLSPQFSAKQREYIVYLPYEVEALNISAAAAAAKAKQVSITGQNDLLPGQINIIEIAVTAEDDSTQAYKIAAYRAPEFAGLEGLALPIIEGETEQTEETTVAETTIEETTTVTQMVSSEIISENDEDTAKPQNTWISIVLAILLVISLAVAAVVFYQYMKLKRKTNIGEI